MNKTILYDLHKQSGAKLINFSGWHMPVQYEGVKIEHQAVRKSAGMFDVSHMGEIEITGTDSRRFCQYLTTNNIDRLKIKKAQYTLLCNKSGGVVDDVIVYKLSDDKFFFCVNASNTEKVYKWMLEHSDDYEVEVINRSDEYGQIAIQGPESIEILNTVFDYELNNIKRFSFDFINYGSGVILAARTGYTGEDGFELFIPVSETVEIWEELYRAGSDYGLKLCGLASRDTLRIEMAYPLYGHEIDEDISPLEAGLQKYVKFENLFIGSKELSQQHRDVVKRTLIGIEMLDRGVPRAGYRLFKKESSIGYITSGTMSPSLNKGIGMCLVDSSEDFSGDLYIEMRGKLRKVKKCELPFYN